MLKTLSLLFRKTSLQASRDQALALVLDWLVDRLQVQACALYAGNPETHELRILVLRGEEGMDHPPPSLAGVVAQGFEPVRLSQPWRHPSYEPEPAVEQQRFQAYLGVPIIRLRKVLGVIEAQRTDDRQFDEDDTSLLLTIALQLSGMIEGAEPKSRSRRGQPEMYTGTPAAPGVAVGRVYTPAAHAALDAVPDRVASNVDTEIRDFQDAVSAVRAELRDSGRGTGTSVPEDLTALYQAYEMILEDPHLVDAVIARIRSGQWAPAAVRDATQELISRFEAVDDAYLRARAEDIRSIGRRILYHLQSHANTFADFPQRTVLLGQSMGLTCIAGVPADRLAGLICTGGSLLSHGVIVARALGIPAVIGATGLISSQCAGREIILDGYRGRVILDPAPEVRAEFQRLQRQESHRATVPEIVRSPGSEKLGARIS